MTSINHGNLTGSSVKDARNVLHTPGIFHHRLLETGAKVSKHKTTIHPINKYSNARDNVSKTDTVTKTAAFRSNTSAMIIVALFAVALLYTNVRSM